MWHGDIGGGNDALGVAVVNHMTPRLHTRETIRVDGERISETVVGIEQGFPSELPTAEIAG